MAVPLNNPLPSKDARHPTGCSLHYRSTGSLLNMNEVSFILHTSIEASQFGKISGGPNQKRRTAVGEGAALVEREPQGDQVNQILSRFQRNSIGHDKRAIDRCPALMYWWAAGVFQLLYEQVGMTGIAFKEPNSIIFKLFSQAYVSPGEF